MNLTFGNISCDRVFKYFISYINVTFGNISCDRVFKYFISYINITLGNISWERDIAHSCLHHIFTRNKGQPWGYLKQSLTDSIELDWEQDLWWRPSDNVSKKNSFSSFYKEIYKITFWKWALAKTRVSITVWKTWKGSRHYTPSHKPSWTVWREFTLWQISALFPRFSFLWVIFSRVPIRYRNISWKTQNSVEILALWRLVFPLQFLVLPNFHPCFYNRMETRKMFSIS